MPDCFAPCLEYSVKSGLEHVTTCHGTSKFRMLFDLVFEVHAIVVAGCSECPTKKRHELIFRSFSINCGLVKIGEWGTYPTGETGIPYRSPAAPYGTPGLSTCDWPSSS